MVVKFYVCVDYYLLFLVKYQDGIKKKKTIAVFKSILIAFSVLEASQPFNWNAIKVVYLQMATTTYLPFGKFLIFSLFNMKAIERYDDKLLMYPFIVIVWILNHFMYLHIIRLILDANEPHKYSFHTA